MLYPTVNIGSVELGVASDDARIAFQKFNLHDHCRVVVPDFRYYNLSLGDDVYVYDELGEEVFAGTTPASIDYISEQELRLTKTATKTVTNTYVYLRQPVNSNEIYTIGGINVTAGSNILTFYKPEAVVQFQMADGSGLPGFVRPGTLKQLATYTLEGYYGISSDFHIPTLGLNQDSWLLEARFVSDITTDLQIKVYTGIENQTFSDFNTWENYGSALSLAVPQQVYTQEFFNQNVQTLPLLYDENAPRTFLRTGDFFGFKHEVKEGSIRYQLKLAKVLS